MKNLIVGYGAVGEVLARLLAKQNSIEKILCIDYVDKEVINNEKISFQRVDITNKEAFLNLLRKNKFDLVINTALPKFNLRIMEGCLEAKTNYMDLASFWDYDKNPNARSPYKIEQLDYNNRFKKQKLIGLFNAGVAPGLDNMFAAEAASELDEVDYIKIRMVEDTGRNELFFSWNRDWLLDELSYKPLVYQNGKFKIAKSFGAEEEYEFPLPIGKRKTCYFAQDEVGSIPLYIKTKNLDVKINDNNLASIKKLAAMKSKKIPCSFPGEEKRFPDAQFTFAVEAIGKKNSKRKSIQYFALFPKQSEINNFNLNANFISYPTALSASLFALAIPKITSYGVFPPEYLTKEIRKSIINELKRNKIKIIKKTD